MAGPPGTIEEWLSEQVAWRVDVRQTRRQTTCNALARIALEADIGSPRVGQFVRIDA